MPTFSIELPFQSAPPVKGATGVQFYDYTKSEVSIRAPREGGDQKNLSLRI